MHGRWFKSVICMRYTSKEEVSQAKWEGKLKKLQHRPIKPAQRDSVGFSSVFGYLSPEMMSHELQHFLFISLTIEEKKLPKNKVKRAVEIKIREMEKKEDKTLSKEEKASIKDHVESEMLKDIVADESYINAFLDTKNDLIFIDAGSDAKAKRLNEFLSKVDDGFEASDYFQASLHVYLTNWLYKPGECMPSDVHLNDEATLKHDKEKSQAVFSKQDLESEEIITLINHDKTVVQVSLVYQHKLAFKLNAKGQLKKLRATDLLKGEIEKPENITSIIQEYEADWIMMANQLMKLYQWFEKVFEVNNDGNNSNNDRDQKQESAVATLSKSDLEKESIEQMSSLKSA